MAAKPRKKRVNLYRPYPEYQALRSGCKVSWYYYAKKEDAEAAAEAARWNAQVQWNLGYDFGYQSPGSSIQQSDWAEYKGLWEVCIP